MRSVRAVAASVTLGFVAVTARAQQPPGAADPVQGEAADQTPPPQPPDLPAPSPAEPAAPGASPGQAPAATAPPARAWSGPYPAPGKPPPGLRPPSATTPYLRRPVELIPEVNLAFPHCAPGDESDDRCTGVRGGAGFGFSALWRVTPHLAWGGGFDIAGFQYDPPERLALRRSGAAAVQLRLLGRFYFVTEGSFDPYVEIGVGGAALGTSARDSNGDRFEQTGAGPALSVGGGLDFFLSRRLRLGPQLTVTQVFVDKIRRCRGDNSGSCEDLAKGDHGHLDRYATLGVRLTIMIGDEL